MNENSSDSHFTSHHQLMLEMDEELQETEKDAEIPPFSIDNPPSVVHRTSSHENEKNDRDLEKGRLNRNTPEDTMSMLKTPEPSSFSERFFTPLCEKGFISNLCTFLVMVFGIVFTSIYDYKIFDFILAGGLFGFAGGVTNWLAIKMLFDRIPFLYGSGVIPHRFKEIRETVKNVMLATFFDPAFMEKYLRTKSTTLIAHFDFNAQLQNLLESDNFDHLLDEKLVDLSQRPEGMWLGMMGLSMDQLKPMIKPFVASIGGDFVPLLLKNFDPLEFVDVHTLRAEVDTMMTVKLEELTPEIVKRLLEIVIRTHLGWLIVWGNVFGACIGLVSKAVGY
eukprot:GCRY01001067.1.p2 GENE.GCRY01001067.1~~GCRY01001067.1.p2  ORF type:complete len:335 (-),score=40.31 GCRY01001067.1:1387-2391(-)